MRSSFGKGPNLRCRLREVKRGRARGRRALALCFSGDCVVPGRAGMRLRRGLVCGALCAALAGCGPSIAQINARPDKYYQKKVDVVAQIRRLQQLEGEALLELADESGRRILVRAEGTLEVATGDWVK